MLSRTPPIAPARARAFSTPSSLSGGGTGSVLSPPSPPPLPPPTDIPPPPPLVDRPVPTELAAQSEWLDLDRALLPWCQVCAVHLWPHSMVHVG